MSGCNYNYNSNSKSKDYVNCDTLLSYTTPKKVPGLLNMIQTHAITIRGLRVVPSQRTMMIYSCIAPVTIMDYMASIQCHFTHWTLISIPNQATMKRTLSCL